MKCEDCDNEAVVFVQCWHEHWADQGFLCDKCCSIAHQIMMPYLLLETGDIRTVPIEEATLAGEFTNPTRTDECNNCTPKGPGPDQEAGQGTLSCEVKDG